jgi:hypothetical protein
MRLTSGSIKATGWSRRCTAVRRRDGRDLVGGGAVGNTRELAGVGAAMAARFLHLKPNEGGRGNGGSFDASWRS